MHEEGDEEIKDKKVNKMKDLIAFGKFALFEIDCFN